MIASQGVKRKTDLVKVILEIEDTRKARAGKRPFFPGTVRLLALEKVLYRASG